MCGGSVCEYRACGNMRPLDENKRSVVRGLEAQSFWRAKREQNFLEPCQGALATQRSISTDHAIAVHDWRARSAKTAWERGTCNAPDYVLRLLAYYIKTENMVKDKSNEKI